MPPHDARCGTIRHLIGGICRDPGVYGVRRSAICSGGKVLANRVRDPVIDFGRNLITHGIRNRVADLGRDLVCDSVCNGIVNLGGDALTDDRGHIVLNAGRNAVADRIGNLAIQVLGQSVVSHGPQSKDRHGQTPHSRGVGAYSVPM